MAAAHFRRHARSRLARNGARRRGVMLWSALPTIPSSSGKVTAQSRCRHARGCHRIKRRGCAVTGLPLRRPSRVGAWRCSPSKNVREGVPSCACVVAGPAPGSSIVVGRRARYSAVCQGGRHLPRCHALSLRCEKTEAVLLAGGRAFGARRQPSPSWPAALWLGRQRART
jgi:hypothetical protein